MMNSLSSDQKTYRFLWGIPAPVWFLSIGMFCLNLSSVMVFICMTLLTKMFSVRTSQLGSLEGVVDGFSLLMRAFSGLLSDFVRKRKRFLLLGYAICFFARFLLVIAKVFDVVVFSRLLEKVGNGMQASPREALIGDVTPSTSLGRAYGLNKTFGMLGSSLGSLLLLGLFYWNEHFDLRKIFLFAALMAGVSFFLLWVGVKEPPFSYPPHQASVLLSQRFQVFLGELKEFSKDFWKATTMCFFLKMGYFSGIFMVTYVMAQQFQTFLGFNTSNKPLMSAAVLSLQNCLCALFSYPGGYLSDLKDRRLTVFLGMICLLSSMLSFGLGKGSAFWMVIGIIFYGLQYSMQGALMAFMSCTMPARLQGTGFGLFFVTSGISMILSNLFIMNTVWDIYSPSTAFLVVCVPVTIALIVLPFIKINKGADKIA